MNKQLIKKYKKEFDHWLDGGQLLHKDEFGNWENTRDIWDLDSERITAVVINDVFVEFRKAMAEGKPVQYQDSFSKQWLDMKTDNFHVATDTFYEGKYRIKPEEPKFKIGDWITDGIEIWQHKENCRVKDQSSWGLWKPKSGEWCWVFNYLRDVPVLRRVIRIEDNFKNRFDDENYTKAVRVGREYALSDEVGYRFCEPYLGVLPSSIEKYS